MIAVLGASGKTGRHLLARLAALGLEVTAIGRSAARLAGLAATRRVVADLERPETVAAALAPARRIVSLAHARHIETLLACLPEGCERLVATGSTRVFSRLPDPAAEATRAGAAAFAKSGVSGVLLHPSMIYGAAEDRNVNRLLRLIARSPVIPLPDGGRHLVQPVFVDDVVDAFVAALTRDTAPGAPIVVAGPCPISYAEMVRTCARALGRRVVIAPLPAGALIAAARLATMIGVAPPFDAAEIARATDDKAFDVADMIARLGVTPRGFEDGLALALARRRGRSAA